MPNSDPIELTIGHSPDPDDAFMWWPLGDTAHALQPAIDTGRFRFVPVAQDIEQLNLRAIDRGDLDITACSMHTYPYIARRYALTACGASMGEGYGPRVVALPETLDRFGKKVDLNDIPLDTIAESVAQQVSWLGREGVRVAVPGERTTAYLVLRLLLGSRFGHTVIPFEKIIGAVSAGEVEAGLVIHEAQITFAESGLELVVDLGAWWHAATGLPLPLGGNAIRRDLDQRYGPGTGADLAGVLRRSIEHALVSLDHGIDHAQGFAQPGTTRANTKQFIGMYVNDLTIDAGPRGEMAIGELLGRGFRAGLCPDPGLVELVSG